MYILLLASSDVVRACGLWEIGFEFFSILHMLPLSISNCQFSLNKWKPLTLTVRKRLKSFSLTYDENDDRVAKVCFEIGSRDLTPFRDLSLKEKLFSLLLFEKKHTEREGEGKEETNRTRLPVYVCLTLFSYSRRERGKKQGSDKQTSKIKVFFLLPLVC